MPAASGPIRVRPKRTAPKPKSRRVVIRTSGDAGTDKRTVTARESEPVTGKGGAIVGHRKVVHTFRDASAYRAHRARVKLGENTRKAMLADLADRTVYEKRTGKRDLPADVPEGDKRFGQKAHGDKRAPITTADRVNVRRRARKVVRAQRAVDERQLKATGRTTSAEGPGVKDALGSLSKTLHETKLKPARGRHGIGGLLANAVDEVRDTVVSAPGAAVELGKTARSAGRQLQRKIGVNLPGSRSMDIPGDDSEAKDAKRVAAFKKGIQTEDPVYALGEAAVKAAKGDSKGARKALRRAGEKAYERPVSAALTATAGAGTADRALSRAVAGSKAEHIARQARPDKVVREPGDRKVRSQADLTRQRRVAADEVRHRQAGVKPQARKRAKIRKAQRYSPGLVRRTVQKAREDRTARKGQDPLELKGRAKKKAVKRSFDVATRNVKAGSLAREERAHGHRRASAKQTKGDLKAAAHELLVGGSVRHESIAQDLDRLIAAQKAHGGEHAAHNIELLGALKRNQHLFADEKIREAAARDARALNESEARLAGEGYFGDTSPDFVRQIQPHLHRGDIAERDSGSGPAPSRNGGGKENPPPLPPPSEHPRLAQQRQANELRKQAQAQPDTGSGRQKAREQRQAANELDGATQGARSAESRAEEARGLRESAMAHREAQAHIIDQLNELAGKAAAVPMKAERRYVTGRDGVRRSKQVRKPRDGRAHKQLAEIRRQVAVLREKHSTHGANAQRLEARADALDGSGTHRPAVKREPSPQDLANQARRDAARGQFDFEANAKGEAAAPSGPAREGGRQGGRPASLSARPTPAQRKAARARATASVQTERPQTTVRVEGERVAVDADRGRYVWMTGPHKGKAVRPEHLDDPGHAFIRGSAPDTQPDMAPKTPQAGAGYSAADVLGRKLGAGRVHDAMREREGTIGLIRLNRMLVDRFAVRDHAEGATHYSQANAEKVAKAHSSPGDAYRAVKTGDGPDSWIVLPEPIARRWERQFAEPGKAARAGRILTRQFVRTVLPFSAIWHLGNAADLYTRLALTARRGDASKGVLRALDDAMRELDPHLRDELLEPLKGHMGSRATVRVPAFRDLTHDAKRAWVRDLGEVVSSIKETTPGVKHAARGLRAATDQAFDLGKGMESLIVGKVAGREAKRYARELGLDVADHIRLGQQLAHEFKADPAKMEEFQRRTLEIVGDYVTKSPAERAIINQVAPFMTWLKASNTFVFHTLPAKHPIKTALALWAASVTSQERARIGLNYYYSDSELRAWGFPPAHRGFLNGAADLGGGVVIPLSPYTSFGTAGELLSSPARLAKGALVPHLSRPVEKAIRYGPEVGAQHLAESFLVGPKQARRALEHGGVPNPRSTVLHPMSSGGSRAATVAGVLTGPQAARDFEQIPKPAKPGHERHGSQLSASPEVTLTTGSGKNKRTIKVRRSVTQ